MALDMNNFITIPQAFDKIYIFYLWVYSDIAHKCLCIITLYLDQSQCDSTKQRHCTIIVFYVKLFLIFLLYFIFMEIYYCYPFIMDFIRRIFHCLVQYLFPLELHFDIIIVTSASISFFLSFLHLLLTEEFNLHINVIIYLISVLFYNFSIFFQLTTYSLLLHLIL